ncbi:MAG: hypothetical protein QOD72_3147 [Acidimicrobiaceae bacterium]|jgi:hypothetical protein|nr:hypothetical protein [Acidimicrobiaceae bacterium]
MDEDGPCEVPLAELVRRRRQRGIQWGYMSHSVMNRRWPVLLVTVALVATSCGGGGSNSANTTANAPSSTTGQGSPHIDVNSVVAAAAGLSTASLAGRDPLGNDLLAAMGVSAALGDEAAAILAQADDARSAADEKLPKAADIVAGLGKSRLLATGANEILWVLIEYLLPLYLDNLTGGSGGPESRTEDAEPVTQTGSAPGTTSTVNQTTTVGVTGSVVEVILRRVEHDVVTDPTTGATIFDRTDDRTVTGTIDVCPDTGGGSNATVSTTIAIDVTTTPGAGGRVGVHSTGAAHSESKFQGQVSDAASLGKVTQDFKKTSQWKTTAAADAGPSFEHGGSVDVNFTGLNSGADASGALDPGTLDASGLGGDASFTGDGNQKMIDDSIGNAAIDIVTISPSYVEAQRLWQHGRCVVVTAPSYSAETPIDTGQQNSSQHTEQVDKGSTTTFATKLRQRFSGGVTASTQSELVDGKKSLDPKSIPSGEGTLTYVAGDENGQDATAKLTSTSKRGIGTLVLTFHTGTKQLTVAISGSELFDGDIDTKLTYSPVLITKQADGSLSGGGTSDAKGTFAGCSGIALSETGTVGLTATQATKDDGTPGDWSIVSAMVPTNSNVVISCDGQSLPGVGTFFGGVGYNFVHDLGTITVPAEGGTVQLHKEGAYGPIDGTVIVTVPKDG